MKLSWLIPAFAVATLAAAPVYAQPAGGNSSQSAPSGGDRAAQWNPSMLQRAKAVPLPSVDPDKVRAAGRDRAARQGGPEGTTASIDKAAGTGERAAGNVTHKPLYWGGKLFFREPDGDYVCSGQFISPTVILTAAHCVRNADTGEWYDDFLFALQYNNGDYNKLYSYECVATKNGWVQDSFERYLYDFAMILVDNPSATGNFGTHWNWRGEYKDAHKIGYPGGVSDGEVMQVEEGPIAFVDGVVQMKHGNTADQGGSSGGAWIGSYTDGKTDDANYIISVESFGYDEEPGVDYGPYLTEDFKDLWDYVENGCE